MNLTRITCFFIIIMGFFMIFNNVAIGSIVVGLGAAALYLSLPIRTRTTGSESKATAAMGSESETRPQIPVKIKGRKIKLMVRNGDILRLVDAEIIGEGIVATKDKLWKLPKFKPYILMKSKTGVPLIIVDENYQIIYEFEDPNLSKIENEAKKAGLNVVMLNPKVLRHYLGSDVVRKLMGKIATSRGEQLLYFMVGVAFTFIIEFFILPLLGFRIIIGG